MVQQVDIGGVGRVQWTGGMNEHSHWKKHVHLNPKKS